MPFFYIPIMTLIVRSAERNTTESFPFRERVSVVMLVHDANATRHFGPISANLTERLERWLREQANVASLIFSESLDNVNPSGDRLLVVANYDWLRRMPKKGRALNVARQALRARKLGATCVAAPVDLWSIRQNVFSSLLLAVAGGWTLVCQNSAQQARNFLLPNPIEALWNWPKSEAVKWIGVDLWHRRNPLALVARSGDPVRSKYFDPLEEKLRDQDYRVEATTKTLPWDEYVALVQSARVVATTCWIQPDFLVGPTRFRRHIADGHITMRFWEGLAVGATVFVPKITALTHLGFEADVHYVELPASEQWHSWQLPSQEVLETIAKAGNLRFRELCGIESG